jgi:hypothetical protein
MARPSPGPLHKAWQHSLEARIPSGAPTQLPLPTSTRRVQPRLRTPPARQPAWGPLSTGCLGLIPAQPTHVWVKSPPPLPLPPSASHHLTDHLPTAVTNSCILLDERANHTHNTHARCANARLLSPASAQSTPVQWRLPRDERQYLLLTSSLHGDTGYNKSPRSLMAFSTSHLRLALPPKCVQLTLLPPLAARACDNDSFVQSREAQSRA